ncbi:glycosyltransferase family A protein [Mechercharimyces sp. CAU 1602]|uniref:glycosyltransferase family 2 protein n=1 Tax=Mechercharimyces sp. CAU 1602 TaxID=2973933 RepID=UPI0021635666|nr:glycosyltransferase family A protein [Mechercharimyces sp. CAU 1602]MCS1350161.1 glycosyltransferase family 2 protein [Mechercharimyces sp. CAU 1602]
MKRSDVGIVMPVYNQVPKYLRMAIKSILKQQSYTNFRLVIVLDGADEQTKNIVYNRTRADKRVHIIDNKVNQGVAHSLNVGFDYLCQLPNIQYLTWVSSDNIYYPRFVERLRQGLINSSVDIGLVYSYFYFMDENDKILHDCSNDSKMVQSLGKHRPLDKEEVLDLIPVGPSFMYRKRDAMLVGKYRRRMLEDYDYWLRMSEVTGIRCIPIPLMAYRRNTEHSVSRSISSLHGHRRWRNVKQYVIREARERRNISTELTIIYVAEGRRNVLSEVENLLEGIYTNFTIWIVSDRQGEVKEKLKLIPDPRIKILPYRGPHVERVYQELLKEVNTPFTLIYSQGLKVHGFDIYFLMKRLKGEKVPLIRSIKRTQRLKKLLDQNLTLINSLNHTSKLREDMLKS